MTSDKLDDKAQCCETRSISHDNLHNACRSMFYVLCIHSFVHLTTPRPHHSFVSVQYSKIGPWIDKIMIDLSYSTGTAAMSGHEKTVRIASCQRVLTHDGRRKPKNIKYKTNTLRLVFCKLIQNIKSRRWNADRCLAFS